MPNQGNSAGPVIATVIILVVIILGGLYFWGARSNSTSSGAPEVMSVNEISTQSSSDDLNSIADDLNSTNVDNLDSELNAI